MRGAGFDATLRRRDHAAALRAAGAACSGKECLPYQLIWGTLARFLGARATAVTTALVFVSIGRGFQACRANLFPVTQQIPLERLGSAATASRSPTSRAYRGLGA